MFPSKKAKIAKEQGLTANNSSKLIQLIASGSVDLMYHFGENPSVGFQYNFTKDEENETLNTITTTLKKEGYNSFTTELVKSKPTVNTTLSLEMDTEVKPLKKIFRLTFHDKREITTFCSNMNSLINTQIAAWKTEKYVFTLSFP